MSFFRANRKFYVQFPIESEIGKILQPHKKGGSNESGNWRQRQAAPDQGHRREKAQMNPLKLRLQIFGCIALALAAHWFATDIAANDPEGMAIYHGSGAIMDLLLCLVVTDALRGQRGRIMGCLMAASIATNIAGWLLYMAYVSPVYYNGAMWALTAAQVACLFVPDSLAAKARAVNPSALRFGVRAQPQ